MTNTLKKEIDDILLDVCDYDCVVMHSREEHEALRVVVRDRLYALIEKLTL